MSYAFVIGIYDDFFSVVSKCISVINYQVIPNSPTPYLLIVCYS